MNSRRKLKVCVVSISAISWLGQHGLGFFKCPSYILPTKVNLRIKAFYFCASYIFLTLSAVPSPYHTTHGAWSRLRVLKKFFNMFPKTDNILILVFGSKLFKFKSVLGKIAV